MSKRALNVQPAQLDSHPMTDTIDVYGRMLSCSRGESH